jgi:hypothetical protein
MANRTFYTKEITDTPLELCYVTGWVEHGKCSLFIRTKDSQFTFYDLGVLTHKEAGIIWNEITDRKSMLKYVKSSEV